MSRGGEMIGRGHNRRLYPRLFDCDYLHLSTLREAVRPFATQCRGQLLDYGCGSKPYRELFTHTTSYTGADFEVYDRHDMMLGADGRLPCDDESFDAITSFQVLEHVKIPSFFLAECCRVLRPGGLILLTTHGMWPYHPGPHNDDFFRWTASGLEILMCENSFTTISISGVCRGYLCLLQQLLVLHDPARTKRSLAKRIVYALYSGIVNLAGMVAFKIMPEMSQQGDILPVCYVVVARKTV
ncbi:class I SAM-dependent methyltransferase [Oryzomonas rubra]|nr:class I SAM-dependent methyltransferase [Oryzomonas rubra]